MKNSVINSFSDLVDDSLRFPRSKYVKSAPRSGSSSSHSRKTRLSRKPTESQKKEVSLYKKPNLNHTDYAYRDAVNRLKSMLADSHSAVNQNTRRTSYESDNADNISVIERPALSEISKYIPPSASLRYKSIEPYSPSSVHGTANQSIDLKVADSITSLQPLGQYVPKANDDLLQFIEKQEGYIEQLEHESQFCRGELRNILNKVKDVVSENEALTEQTKLETIASDTSESGSFDYNYKSISKDRCDKAQLSGPNIVFESRISELEAQLTQAEIDIKRLTQENNLNKEKLASDEGIDVGTATSDVYRQGIEKLQRDKMELEGSVRKLQCTVDTLKATDAQHFSNSLRSRDIAEQSAFEKAQSDLEIRRLRDELERQHIRLREMQHEMTKKIAEERSLAERRYNYQVDQLGGDLSNQWETRLQLELEHQKRIEADYRRDLAQKISQIEDLRSEMKQKTTSLLSDLAQVNAEKQSLEQEMTSLRLQLERAERQAKVESSRLSAEIVSLRQRLDRADADLLQSKRENLQIKDELAMLEKEVTLGDLNRETRPSKELNKLLFDMEAKHVATVSELEGMVQDQRQLMEKLTAECKSLTNKLEDATLKHKQEMNTLQSKIDYLTNKVETNSIDKINSEDFIKYEQAAATQGADNRSNVFDSITQQVFSSSASPVQSFKHDGKTNQQSRRGSLFEPPQRRTSQQSIGGQLPNENTSSSITSLNKGDEYMQESIENEKTKSLRISPNTEDNLSQSGEFRRKGSIRFYDDIQSVDNANKKKDETSSVLQQDDTAFGKIEYEYKESPQEYDQQIQEQSEHSQKQEPIYPQLGYADQSQDIYAPGEYNSASYIDEQSYGGSQYRTDTLHHAGEYDYPSGYQGYDAQNYEQPIYQPAEQTSEPMRQQEQYGTELYEEKSTISALDDGTFESGQQRYSESSSSNTNMGQKYNGNGNNSVNTPKQQTMSKQPAKKKFT